MSIEINGLEHVYSPNTPFEHAALKGIDCSIAEGKVTAIIGPVSYTHLRAHET